ITPDMVTAVQENYYNPLFTQEAADAFSRKLYLYTGVVTPVKWNQWKPVDVKPDENGELVHWPGGEHAVVVCGYDDASLTYRDPNAGTTVAIDYSTFEKSFTELGGRIVYYAAQP
ncbi:MAG: hypothetical protein VZQ96_10025, partial [Succiniclasticum sp.]|nr:hypothetical protein [Succiniclasticum sp.]